MERNSGKRLARSLSRHRHVVFQQGSTTIAPSRNEGQMRECKTKDHQSRKEYFFSFVIIDTLPR